MPPVLQYVNRRYDEPDEEEEPLTPEELQEWMNQLKEDGRKMADAPREVKSNYDLVKAATAQNGLALTWADQDFQKDPELVRLAVPTYPGILYGADESLTQDHDLVLLAVQKDGMALRNCQGMDKHRDIVLAAVRNEAEIIKHIDWDWREDREVMTLAMEGYPEAYALASDEIKADSEIAAKAIKAYPKNLKEAPLEILDDIEVVKAAVRQNGHVFGDLPMDKKTDLEVVLAALSNENTSMAVVVLFEVQQADPALLENKQVALAALKASSSALRYLKSFKDDKEMVLEAVKHDGGALRHASDRLRADEEVVRAAVTCEHGIGLPYAADAFKENKAFVLWAVEINPMIFDYLSEQLQADEDVKNQARAPEHRTKPKEPPSADYSGDHSVDG
mmetsp:Transcript_6851/g.15617  ORF Transcript_6851/g.15617 Transcript_6851/m.15617 type:complete len:391 (+) Transcript_6851:129-1301(+)